MAWDSRFEHAFYPKSIAIVGISADAERKSGSQPSGVGFLISLEQLGFKGKIYPVNPKTGEILGYKTYPLVVDIPDQIDLVIVAVPARFVPEVLEDCSKAGAKNIHIFTAGFEETGELEGIELGKRVKEIIKLNSLRVVGPNCMGIYVPEARIGPFGGLTPKRGPVALVSQSGGHLNWYSHYGPNYGIYFSKGISFGNAYSLDSTDFLEYLALDPKTEIICMYLEGVKDGPKLRRQVQEINLTKPVVMMKAGLTETGARAVASHTASLAGQEPIWRSFFAQTGAVQVNTLEELAEMTMTFLCLKPTRGNRVAVISLGGGTSVSAADICSREGLEVPPLTQSTQDELKKFIPLAGFSIRNPLDTGMVFKDLGNFDREIECVTADPNIDMMILMPHWDMARDIADELIEYIIDTVKNYHSDKPIVLVPHSFANDPWETEIRTKLKVDLPNKGVAVYASLTAASRALARFVRYHRMRAELISENE